MFRIGKLLGLAMCSPLIACGARSSGAIDFERGAPGQIDRSEPGMDAALDEASSVYWGEGLGWSASSDPVLAQPRSRDAGPWEEMASEQLSGPASITHPELTTFATSSEDWTTSEVIPHQSESGAATSECTIVAKSAVDVDAGSASEPTQDSYAESLTTSSPTEALGNTTPSSSPGSESSAAFTSKGQQSTPDAGGSTSASDTGSPLRCNGVVGLPAPPAQPTGGHPVSVTSGDFNHDGHGDLAVANALEGEVAILFNRGNGSYDAPRSFVAGIGPTALTVADFDIDSNLDLVVADATGTSVNVLYGNADGTFEPYVAYPAGPEPRDVAAADVNSDGWPDLIVANFTTNRVTILFNDAEGGFLESMSHHAGSDMGPDSVLAGARDLAIADFDGQNGLDLAVSIQDLSLNAEQIAVSLNLGDGTFAEPIALRFRENPVGVEAVDFNGDGLTDLATAYSSDRIVSVFINLGSGVFASPLDFRLEFSPGSLVAGNLDGDLLPDLFVSALGFGTGQALLNRGDGTFAEGARTTLGYGSYFAIALADVNGDNNLDLASTNIDSGEVGVLFNQGTGAFWGEYAVGKRPQTVAAADLNGDGMTDLAVANQGDDSLSVLFNQGGGILAPKLDLTTQAGPRTVVAADLNADGYIDLAANCPTASSISVFFNGGDGHFEPAVELDAGQSPLDVAAADFNGDGRVDLAAANNNGTVTILMNQTSGIGQSQHFEESGTSLVSADFDSDGHFDLALISREASDKVVLNNGNGSFSMPRYFRTGEAPIALAAGDLNGDGFADLAIADDYAEPRVDILLNHGDGSFQPLVSYLSGVSATNVALADLDGDRSPDVALTSGGELVVFVNQGDGTFLGPVHYGAAFASTGIAAADLNADDRPDLVTVSSETGTLSVRLNTCL